MANLSNGDSIELIKFITEGIYYVDGAGQYKKLTIDSTDINDNGISDTITSDTNISQNYGYYPVNTAAGNVTMTFVTEGLRKGKEWVFYKTSALNSLIIAPELGNSIDNDTDGVTIADNNAYIKIMWDGTRFKIIT